MSSPVSSTHSLEPDPFRYGWRDVRRQRPDGTTESDMVPLTLEDVLHPQEGDHIPENSRHEAHRTHFHNVVRSRLVRQPTRLSLSDCLVDWDRIDLPPHSPDLIVLERDLPWPWRSWSTLHVKQEQARPVLIIEIVSPSTRSNDVVDKVEHYYRVGVSLYVIIDSQRDEGPLQLVAYRHTPKGYVPLPADARGRLPLEPLGLYLLVMGDRVAVFDAETETELGDYVAVYEQLKSEIQAREAAEKARAEAETARTEAETARAQAETARAAAEAGRTQAETARAQAETARAEAERLAQEQAQARAAADRRAQEQAEGRLAAEARLQALQAELERLRGQAG